MKRLGMGLAVVFCWMGASCAFAEFSSIDLEVESIQIQPSGSKAEASVTAVAVVRNNGSQSAEPFDISISVRQNKKLVRAVQKIPVLSTLPRMGSGKSVPIEIGKLSEGDYEVTAVADPENKLKETNEGNNARSRNFHVPAAGYGSTYGTM